MIERLDLRPKRRLAADVLGIGKSRVRFDPASLDRIADAITRDNIRALVKEGAIMASPVKGVSRGRKRTKAKRRRGPGSLKGKRGARLSRKENWMLHVRALRRRLRIMKERRDINTKQYRELYMKVKGGQIRSVRHLNEMVRTSGAS